MPDLDATVGGANANSFVSLDEADAYLDARLNASAWTGEDVEEDDKVRALIEATRDLSNLEPLYQGYRTGVQALAFPRTLVINTKAPWLATIGLTGYPQYADDIIPPDLIAATCELALEYLKAGTTDLARTDEKNTVIQKTVGPLTTKYAEPEKRPTGLARFPRVLDLIRPLFADAPSSASLTVVRM